MGVGVRPATIRPWEIWLRAARVAAMKSFYVDMYVQMRDAQACSEISWTIGCHSLRLPRHEHRNLAVAEVSSAFITSPTRPGDDWSAA
eukprot:9362082-Alexandrium_andersonii.AAC.1